MDSANIALPVRKSFQVFLNISYYFICLVLLVSGIAKIIDPSDLLNTLNPTLNFLDENIIVLIAAIISIIEITVGLFLLLKIKVKESLVTTVFLFAVFTIFAVYGFIFGIDGDCGCFGNITNSGFDSGMIIRNFVFLLMSIINLKYFKISLN